MELKYSSSKSKQQQQNCSRIVQVLIWLKSENFERYLTF